MTNKERQHSLDKQKWEESQSEHKDMSGSMFYCDCCNSKLSNSTCCSTQAQREINCLCAKAFNRLKRRKVIDK